MDEFLRSNWRSMSHTDMAAALGKTRPSVRNRCWRLKLTDDSTQWTDDEVAELKAAYTSAKYGEEINLQVIAARFGRHKSNVCRKARALGLTDISRDLKAPENRRIRKPMFETIEERRADRSKRAKVWIATNGHPRGALGMTHTDAAKEKIRQSSIAMNFRRTPEQKAESLMKAMKTKERNGTMVQLRLNASWKAGWREIGGVRKYYRSKWEANYAHYLQWLKSAGQIEDWKHEPKTFWFEGVKRGCVSYLPDFWVKENGGAEAYHEVKGWMDARSVTKIKRMAKYHPSVRLVVIDSKGYNALKKTAQAHVPGWEK